jgi:hypothetical protein
MDSAFGLADVLVSLALSLVFPLGMLGYFVLQPLMVRRLRGGWRVAAYVPLVPFVPLLLHALYALAAGSNLWPLLVILYLPVATTYLLVLAGARYFARGWGAA